MLPGSCEAIQNAAVKLEYELRFGEENSKGRALEQNPGSGRESCVWVELGLSWDR